jgi:hypothetical protein
LDFRWYEDLGFRLISDFLISFDGGTKSIDQSGYIIDPKNSEMKEIDDVSIRIKDDRIFKLKGFLSN